MFSFGDIRPGDRRCAGAYCDAGTCRAYVAAGGACSDPAECGPLSCVSGTCVDDDVACVP